MAPKRKSQKTTKASGQRSISEKENGSFSSGRNTNSEKPAPRNQAVPKKGRRLTFTPSAGVVRTPLIEEEPQVERCELVDFGTTNTNLIQQLRLITAYPFILDEKVRHDVMDIVKRAILMPNIEIQMEAVKLVTNLQKVNLGVFKQLASDQVQRHLSFDRQDEGKTEKQKVLEAMSDEELELLEKMAEKMGGSIPVGQ